MEQEVQMFKSFMLDNFGLKCVLYTFLKYLSFRKQGFMKSSRRSCKKQIHTNWKGWGMRKVKFTKHAIDLKREFLQKIFFINVEEILTSKPFQREDEGMSSSLYTQRQKEVLSGLTFWFLSQMDFLPWAADFRQHCGFSSLNTLFI